ncbi:class F sortase [Herbiconiux flava]|uniref:Class F sortase n=1 Tax=Herbiconiux flava TaxID=881268 RepID=A0A852STC5_9MICO|nr:class F sortase [Herbiconiux flava]NYD72226.1 hypothetical protein [Herbiconiux flava]GLK17809.1 hypothetical protein GCM10017602_22910 [Herbiconiux flava]
MARAGAPLALAAALVAGVVTGCSAPASTAVTAPATSPDGSPAAVAPTAAPAPASSPAAVAPAVPEVPRTDAALPASIPAVPEPARVEVPALGIDVSVLPEGIDDAGALALPEDPGVASWYRYGPSPFGDAGSSVIAAHVDSLEYGLGDFASLAGAAPGTEVVVSAVDGSTTAFAVVSVETADKTGVPWATVFDRTGEPRLTLITCGGEFDYGTGHYLSNVIVTAAPVT